MAGPIESALRKNLVTLIRAYAKATGKRETTVCLYAYGDARLLKSLLSGATFQLKIYERLVAWFARQDWNGHDMPVLIDPKHNQRGIRDGAKSKEVRRKKVGGAQGSKAQGSKARRHRRDQS